MPRADTESAIEEVFGRDGYLAKAFPGYEPREGQVALARAVFDAIDTNTNLLAEAGTGTGKSVAYLVPSILAAQGRGKVVQAEMDDLLGDDDFGANMVAILERNLRKKKKIIVVTGNILLQQQIVEKDLPMLRKILPWPFTFAIAKGISNYLCAKKFERVEPPKQASLFHDEGRSEEDIQQGALYDWSEALLQDYRLFKEGMATRPGWDGSVGDFTELEFIPDPKVLRNFAASSEDCRSSKCRQFGNCVAQEAKHRFHQADIVVTNYHYFLTHLLLSQAIGDKVLPAADIFILDESHILSSICQDIWGFHISEGSCKRLGKHFDEHERLHVHLIERSQRMFRVLHDLRMDKKRYNGRLKGPECQAILDGPAAGLIETLREVKRELAEKATQTSVAEQKFELEKDATRAEYLAYCFETALKGGPLVSSVSNPEDTAEGVDVGEGAYYLEKTDKGETVLSAKVVNPAPLLRVLLFGKKAEDQVTKVTVIMTSATLTVGAGESKFAYVTSQCGIPSGHKTLVADSPFDWRSQALLVIPEDRLVEPQDPVFTGVMTQLFVETCIAARGRTLGLFTSHRNLNEAFEALQKHGGFEVLKQGSMPRGKLIERFKENVHSVLLGADSFWTGVDVQGEALSCVFIDKLPFPSPDDPVIDALRDKYEDWFNRFAIPQSVIKTKQGFGRLIRARTDYGVIVCTDIRLLTKSYGGKYLRSLPDCSKSKDMDDVKRYFDQLDGDI